MTFKSDELIRDLSLNNFEDIIQKYDNKNENFYYSDFDIQKYSTHDIYRELEKINNKNININERYYNFKKNLINFTIHNWSLLKNNKNNIYELIRHATDNDNLNYFFNFLINNLEEDKILTFMLFIFNHNKEINRSGINGAYEKRDFGAIFKELNDKIISNDYQKYFVSKILKQYIHNDTINVNAVLQLKDAINKFKIENLISFDDFIVNVFNVKIKDEIIFEKYKLIEKNFDINNLQFSFYASKININNVNEFNGYYDYPKLNKTYDEALKKYFNKDKTNKEIMFLNATYKSHAKRTSFRHYDKLLLDVHNFDLTDYEVKLEKILFLCNSNEVESIKIKLSKDYEKFIINDIINLMISIENSDDKKEVVSLILKNHRDEINGIIKNLIEVNDTLKINLLSNSGFLNNTIGDNTKRKRKLY